jgi:hypothetical protein
MTSDEVINDTNTQQSENLGTAYCMVEYEIMTKQEARELTEEELVVIMEAYAPGYSTGALKDCQAKHAALDTYCANSVRRLHLG